MKVCSDLLVKPSRFFWRRSWGQLPSFTLCGHQHWLRDVSFKARCHFHPRRHVSSQENSCWQAAAGSDQPPVILFLHMASSVKHSLQIPARAPRGTCDWLACCRHSCQGSPSVLINAIDLPKSCLPRQLGALLAQLMRRRKETPLLSSSKEIWRVEYVEFCCSSPTILDYKGYVFICNIFSDLFWPYRQRFSWQPVDANWPKCLLDTKEPQVTEWKTNVDDAQQSGFGLFLLQGTNKIINKSQHWA